MDKRFKKLIKCVAAVLLVCSMAVVLLPPATAETVKLATVNYSGGLNLRTGAGTSYTSLEIMPNGTVLTILGEAHDAGGALWYKVAKYADPSKEGYVHSGYVLVSTVDTGTGGTDEQFEQYLTSEGFPESYKPALRLLHSMYPQWVFRAIKTGLSWQTVLANEAITARNLVPRSSNKLWINTSDVDSNGNQIGRDGQNWVSASREIVAYYLDPRNFLNLSYMFMFESLSYVEGVQTAEGVENILASTFMDNTHTVVYNGKNYTYAEIFMEVAAATGVSPYHLASRARQEQGVSGTTLSSGTVPGYEGYYNFYNINAYTTSSASAVQNGARHAQSQGWSNPYLSIMGGAAFLAKAYIARGQDTAYFQKFNVVNSADGLFYHQYMSNVMAAASEASTLRSAYADLNTPIAFAIPVYTDMPASAVQKPSETTVPELTLTGCTIGSSYITGASYGTDISALLEAAAVTNGGSVQIESVAGAKKTSGSICTGDVLKLFYASGNLFRQYSFSVRGDLNGDGEITLKDLLAVQKHLLNISFASGASLTAADANGDGSVNLRDLLAIQKHLLKISLLPR